MSEQPEEQAPQHDENADSLVGEEVEPDVEYDPDTFVEDTEDDEILRNQEEAD